MAHEYNYNTDTLDTPYRYKEEQLWFPLSHVLHNWEEKFHKLLLNDKVRMEKYKEAIYYTVEQMVSEKNRLGNKKVLRVMDVGTGLGILSHWVAKKWMDLKKPFKLEIYAIEANTVLATQAELYFNDIWGNVDDVEFHVINKSSYDIELEDLGITKEDLGITKEDLKNDGVFLYNCIDLIISELLGNLGDNEDCVGILSQIISKFKTPKGTIIPKSLEQYIIPITSKNLYKQVEERKIEGINKLYEEILTKGERLPSFNMCYDAIIPHRAHLDNSEHEYLMRWDFCDDKTLLLEYTKESIFKISVDGEFHGFKGYFKAYLTDNIVLDLSPKEDYKIPDFEYSGDFSRFDYKNRKVSDCWKHAYLPVEGKINVKKGDEIILQFSRALSKDLLNFSYKWEGSVNSERLKFPEKVLNFPRPYTTLVSDKKVHNKTIRLELISHEYLVKGEILLDKDIVINQVKNFLKPNCNDLKLGEDNKDEVDFLSDKRLTNEDCYMAFTFEKEKIDGKFLWINPMGVKKEMSFADVKDKDNDWIIYYKLTVPPGNKDEDVKLSNFLQTEYTRFNSFKEKLSTFQEEGTYFLSILRIPSYVMSQFASKEICELQTAFIMLQERIILEHFRKRELEHSIKAAIAAIMSRNMSHNLGSHILSILKRQLYDYEDDKDGYHKGLSWFFNYLQERQDYIATISGFEYQTFVPINFKEFIFDGFLPDKKQKRHDDLPLHRNVILENISLSENIKRDNIEIYFREFDGEDKERHKTSFGVLENLDVSIPGGILGRQAFFSIFENIIRNSSKHGNIEKGSKLKIIIDTPDLGALGTQKIEQKDDKNIACVGLYDSDVFIKFTITDNLGKCSATNLLEVKRAVGEKLIDEFGQVKPKYKGIKEMKISAAWLRGIPAEDIAKERIHDPQILGVEESINGSLQYVIYLMRAKNLLLILKQDNYKKLISELNNDTLDSLKKNGIDVIEIGKINERKYHQHDLNIIDNDLKGSAGKKSNLYLNQRVLYVSYKYIKDIILENASNVDSILYSFWEIRNKQSFQNSKAKIYIIDKNENQNIIKEDNKNNKFVLLNDINELNKFNAKDVHILLKKHNDTLDDFKKLSAENSDLVGATSFIEGISGGNSTELLYRKQKKTKLFYSKLIESSLTKILIIDERLWNNITRINIDEMDDINQSELEDFLLSIKNINDEEEWKSKLKNKTGFSNETELSNFFACRDIPKSFSRLIVGESANIQSDQSTELIRSKWHLYIKKGIEVLNIRYYKNENNFKFFNLKCECVAECTLRNGNINFKIINENKQKEYKDYHITSIHQGILDKMHDKFDVGVINVFDAIVGAFSDNVINVIHSGRSQPPELSTNACFVPYASLENAFYDSKYSLTSILYCSRKTVR